MSWDKQVQKVVTKGNKALGFICRNVGPCPEDVKKQAYLALVRPHFWVYQQRLGLSSPKTYSTDWDGPTPSSTLHQKQLLKRPWYSDNITRTTGITTLSTRRKISRITLLHKAIHEKVAIPIPSYIIKPTRTSRFHHPKRYIQIRPKKDVYKYSFFPRTIRD